MIWAPGGVWRLEPFSDAAAGDSLGKPYPTLGVERSRKPELSFLFLVKLFNQVGNFWGHCIPERCWQGGARAPERAGELCSNPRRVEEAVGGLHGSCEERVENARVKPRRVAAWPLASRQPRQPRQPRRSVPRQSPPAFAAIVLRARPERLLVRDGLQRGSRVQQSARARSRVHRADDYFRSFSH